MADTVNTPIVVTYEGGARFAAHVRSHRLIVDQPESAGGADTGPMPLELLGAALGTCIAYYAQRFLERRGVSSSGLRVEVEQHKTTNPYRIGAFAVRIVAPAGLPPAYVPLLERVAQSCPAHATLTHAADVLVSVETTTAAAA